MSTATARDEHAVIQEAAEAVSTSNWTIGRCASEWCEKYAAGRTDAEFAELIGSSQPTVNRARRIYNRFYSARNKLNLGWYQWRKLLTSDGIEESIDVLLSDDELTPDYENLMRVHSARTQTRQPTPAANLTGADVPAKAEPVAKPKTETAEASDDPPRESPTTIDTSKGTESDYWTMFASRLVVLEQDVEGYENANKKAAELYRLRADKLDPPKKPEKKKATAKRFKPPTVDEVAEYCKSRKNGIDAEAFVAFYESKGWKVGSAKMASWQGAVVTWEKRDKSTTQESEPW